jgi:hypothetical protein
MSSRPLLHHNDLEVCARRCFLCAALSILLLHSQTLAEDFICGKEKVTIRFQATEGNEIATVFGIRLIRADAER